MEFTKKVTEHEIRTNLVNLRQLVIEVTDSCNLKCKYCAFGELYHSLTQRKAGNLDFDQIKPLLNYLTGLWYDKNIDRVTDIGFYGGEPLLNMNLIRQVIDFLENRKTNKIFTYSMTTNGLLLHKYMDYFVEKNFDLLISLDGAESEQGYRLKYNGSNSFKEVYNNVVLLREKYPKYFEKKVNFHSIIHNRNSVRSVLEFFIKEFNKVPSFAEISSNDIKEELLDLYKSMYRSISESIQKDKNPKEILNLLGTEAPGKEQVYQYLKTYSGNVYDTYNSLIAEKSVNRTPTGTCHPFQMKLFVTIKGEILQCEQISRKWTYGYVTKEKLSLDFAYIAEKYNSLLGIIQSTCQLCSISHSCPVCIFYIKGFPNTKRCKEYRTKEQFNQYQSSCLDLILKNPELYNILINETYSG